MTDQPAPATAPPPRQISQASLASFNAAKANWLEAYAVNVTDQLLAAQAEIERLNMELNQLKKASANGS